MSHLSVTPSNAKKFALIIQVCHRSTKDYDMDEMDGLVQTAGYQICTHLNQNVNHLNAHFLIGRGKAESIQLYLDSYFNKKGRKFNPIDSNYSTTYDLYTLEPPLLDLSENDQIEPDTTDEKQINPEEIVDLQLPSSLEDNRDLTIIFNNRLGNMQILNLEKFWKVRVIDRDQVVLEIFEKNARTREAQLQIELARIGLETSRIKKEYGAMVDEHQGMNSKGKGMPGWAPITRAYTERRKHITDELDNIRKNRTLRRKERSKFFNVGIVGYTNAGKTTLLNTLAKKNLDTNNQVFTTVSTASRKVTFPHFDEMGNFSKDEIILTDSVGFVYDISPLFIKAFLSTLEELQFSDLILIVIDIADKKFERIPGKVQTTFQVIEQIGAMQIPKIILFNKSDLLDPAELDERFQYGKTLIGDNPSIMISAKNKLGFEELIQKILELKHQLWKDNKGKKKNY